MAVDDLWYLSKKGDDNKLVPSGRHGRGKRYRVRYTDPSGSPRTQLFHKKEDAKAFDASVRTDVRRGEYIDPRAGRVTFQEVAEHWRSNQVHADNTVLIIGSLFPRHVYPYLGTRPIGSIKRSDVQGLVRRLQVALAPASVKVAYRFVVAVFASAVHDGVIPKTPCVDITLPKIVKKRVNPLPMDDVTALRDAKHPRWRALDDLGALAGLRQGEAFGLEVEHVEFLRRRIRVDQQLLWLPGEPPFLGLPKTASSRRVIPIGRTLAERLAAHLKAFPAVEVEIVDKTGGTPVVRMARLLTTTTSGRPMSRAAYSRQVWRPAVKKVGLAGPGEPTFHDLRHHYASALIAHGASPTQVQQRLGHASAAETLNTYSHLWPDEDDRTRAAIDALYEAPAQRLRSVPSEN
jgi:integrase